jgi:hypothetical protein
MSCSAPGECTAVGFYANTASAEVAMTVSETKGVWGTPVPLPGFTALNVGGAIGSLTITCSAPGDCAVGGEFTGPAPASGQLPASAFTATEVGGTWGNAQPVDTSGLPVGSNSLIVSISCAFPGNCAAAGQDWVTGSSAQAFLVAETGGTWSAAQPVGLGSIPTAGTVFTVIPQVSCAPHGNCAAVGYVYGRQITRAPIIVNDTAGTWGNAQPVAGLPSGTGGGIANVSCSAPGDCAAAGTYVSGQQIHLFGVRESGGTWGGATQIPVSFSSAVQGGASPVALSCAAPGDCTLAGSYSTEFPGSLWSPGVFVVTQSNDTWGKAAPIAGLPSPAVGSAAYIDSVSCRAPGSCSVAGFYYSDGGANIAFVANQAGGTWGSAQNVARMSSTVSDAISCGGPGYCSVAVFQALGSAYAPRELIVNEATASAPVVRPVPAKVTYGDETFRLPVTVTSSAGGTPTGRVSVTAGSAVLCTATLVRGTASCPVTKASLPAGTSHPEATYGGDAAYVSATSPPAVLTIAKASTKATLALGRTTISYRSEEAERLSVTVAGEYGTIPAGRVVVRAGSTVIATITLANGKGTYSLTARQLKAGAYQLTAAYGGSTDFSSSGSAAKTLKVTG